MNFYLQVLRTAIYPKPDKSNWSFGMLTHLTSIKYTNNLRQTLDYISLTKVQNPLVILVIWDFSESLCEVVTRNRRNVLKFSSKFLWRFLNNVEEVVSFVLICKSREFTSQKIGKSKFQDYFNMTSSGNRHLLLIKLNLFFRFQINSIQWANYN